MGLLSYFLIMTFNSRFLAQNGSNLALVINRVRDFFLFLWLVCESSFLVCLAVLTKSSLTLFSSWLPNAMERPTPVSSLLHSSTMVVARVFILSFLGVFSTHLMIVLIFFGVFCRFFGRFIKDFKRTVAFSTSSQLGLIGLFWLMGRHYLTIFYIFTHALFKAIIFMVVRFIIHLVDIQLLSRSNIILFWTNLVFRCLVMSRLPFFSVSTTKDSIVSGFSLVFTSLVVLSTLLYSVSLMLLVSHNLLIGAGGCIGLLTSVLVAQAFLSLTPIELSVDFLALLITVFTFFSVSFLVKASSILTRVQVDTKLFSTLVYSQGTWMSR